MLATVVKNTTAQLVGKFVGVLTTFLVSFVVARVSGASGFGDFIKVTTFVSFFFLVSDFGLNAVALQSKEKNVFSQLLTLRMYGSICLAFIAVALLAFIPQSQLDGYTAAVRFGIVLFAPAILFQSLITTANAVFQKTLRYELATLAQVLGSVVTALFIFFLWAGNIQNGVLTISIFALLGGSAVSAGVSLWFVSRTTPLYIGKFRSALATLFLPTVPLGLTLISNVVYAHADSVILTLTRSTTEVGTYGLAYKVFETILVFPTFFMNAVYPMLLTRLDSSRLFWVTIQKSAWILFFVSILAVAATWIGAPWITLIKSDFAPSIGYVRILALSFPIFFLSSLTMWVLVSLKKRMQLLWIYGLGMIGNIVANAMLVPSVGPTASAWITLFSEACILVASWFVIRMHLSKLQNA